MRLSLPRPVAVAHLSAIALAVALVGIVFQLAWLFPSPYTKGERYNPNLGTGDAYTQSLIQLGDRLSTGDSIVLFGSSELSARSAYVPYRFFPTRLGENVVALGHADFDLLSTYLLLLFDQHELGPRSKIVILLSPYWFGGGQPAVSAFDEFIKDDILYSDNSPDADSFLTSYLNTNYRRIKNPSTAQMLYNYCRITNLFTYFNCGRLVVQRSLYLAYLLKQRLLVTVAALWTPKYSPSKAQKTDAVWWAAQRRAAQASELLAIGANPLLVHNDVARKYPKSYRIGGVPYFPMLMLPSQELRYLRAVLALLSSHKVNALVVLEPLNPNAVNDYGRFNPVRDDIVALTKRYGVSLLDLWGRPFEPGLLIDASHTGEVAWVDIDQRMAAQFK